MPALATKRISRIKIIKEAAPEILARLLEPHREYLHRRGYSPANFAVPLPEDRETLGKIIFRPSEDTPGEFSDAFFLVNEVAAPTASELLIEESKRTGIVVTGSETPADLAILLYLADPEALKRCHGKLIVERMRTYESYQTDRRPLPEFGMPEPAVLERLRKELEGWFESKFKGKGVRVITSVDAPWFGFIFRHGDLMRREGAVEEDGTSGSIVFRPERFDAVFYNASLGELRLNAKSKAEKNKYRTAIGEHLFGDDAFFPPVQERYTLEPLRQNGRDSLFCGDVAGIKAVQLTRVKVSLGGPYSEVRIVEGTDVFDIFEDAGEDFPTEGKIVSATFEILFEGSKKPRKLNIRTPNVASFTRESDDQIIESWLQKRGFILAASEEELEQATGS